MSFPRYPKYKPSGVEWLGDVPEHWTRTRIKHAAKSGQKSFIDGDWIEAPFITSEGVRLLQCGNVGTGVFEEQGFRFVSHETFRDLGCTEVELNDVLICRLQSSKTILAGRSCLAPDLGVKMITSVDNCILKPSSDFDSRYIVYQLTTPGYLSYIEVVARGGTRDRISRSMLGDVEIAAPPVAEQSAIAGFLDRETSKIDGLVGEQRRLIELLKEKRQAVISHAVTKGLNPQAPLKPSGIQWLGDVPEHWIVGPVKRFFTSLDGRRIPLSTEERSGRSGEFAYYGASGIIDWIDEYIFDEGLVLVSEDGANLLNRSTPIAFVATGKYWVNNHAHILKPHDDNLWFWAERIEAIDLVPFVTGSAQPKLTAEAMNNLMIAVPPTPEERAAIQRHFMAETAKLDALTAEAERAIELLQERRTALISAAVTGKIDVRGLGDS